MIFLVSQCIENLLDEIPLMHSILMFIYFPGHVGWGIAWYINGLLIPEIHVVRGKTYTFVVEGGFDPSNPSRYHPFYITDDPEGGYEFKSQAERNV